MNKNRIGTAKFSAICLGADDAINSDSEAVAFSPHGNSLTSPVSVDNREEHETILGAMKGSVLSYAEPLEPAVEPSDWTLEQGHLIAQDAQR